MSADRVGKWGRFALGGVLTLLVAAQAGLAHAAVERVTVQEWVDLGTVGQRRYTWAQGMMEGTVKRDGGKIGRYRVPIVLIYPDRDPNGFGFVDVVNTVLFHIYTERNSPWAMRNVLYLGDLILRDYLKQEGYTYLAVQWSRLATEELGPSHGVIENGLDGYEILRDAAWLIRDLTRIEGKLPASLPKVKRVIAFGFSQSAELLRQFAMTGRNRIGASELTFDGLLIGGAGGMCYVLNNDPPPGPERNPMISAFATMQPCPAPLPEHGKAIAVDMESDITGFRGPRARYSTPSYRRYELAGVAHIAGDYQVLRPNGAPRQNPAGFRPVFKAALHNLVVWIESGKPPPESKYIATSIDEKGQITIVIDEDGNAKGGLRLPHMSTTLTNGERAGAPLGTYGGLELSLCERFDFVPCFAGTFEPFSNEEISRRYPDDDTYVRLVTKAADALLAEGHILAEDRDAYVQQARKQPMVSVWTGE